MDKEENRDNFEKSLKLLVKSSAIVFIGVVLSKLFTYIYRIIIARYYGPEVYGVFSLSLMIFGWFVAFSSLGLSEGLLRYISLYRGEKSYDKLRHIFLVSVKFTFFSGIIAGIALFLLADFISITFFNSPDLSVFLKILGVTLPFALFSNILPSILRAFEKIQSYSFVVNILQPFINLLMLALFIFIGLKSSNSVVFSYSAGFLAAMIVSYLLCRKKAPQIFEKHFLKEKIKKKAVSALFSYSWPLMFSVAAINIFHWIDSFVIGYFHGVGDVGLYNAAIPIVSLLSLFPSLFVQLFFPLITREYSRKNILLIRQLSRQVIKWIFILNLPVFLLVLIFPAAALNVLFGPDYLVARLPLKILIIGGFFYSFTGILTNLISMTGKSKIILANIFIAIILNFSLNLVIIPKYRLTGAASVTAIVWIILSIALLFEVRIFAKIFPAEKSILKIFFISLIPVVLLVYFKQYLFMSLFNTALLSFSFGLLYLFLIFTTGCLDKHDMMILNSVITKLAGMKSRI